MNASGMPEKPPPEVEKLDFFAGVWESEAVVHGELGKLSKYASTSHAEWMEGGFFLVEHWDFELDGAKGKELSLKGYDPVRKVYTYHGFTSNGDAFYDTGIVNGDVWTWMRQERSGAQGRYTIKITSADSYSFHFESSEDGRNWTTVMEGAARKIGASG